MTTIIIVSQAETISALSTLSELLIDSVANGASVGFHRPLARPEADAYWRDVCADVGRGRVLLFAAYIDGQLVGTAQLQPIPKNVRGIRPMRS